MKGEKKRSKNSTGDLTSKKNFYLPILNALKRTKNLTEIRRELNISKQQLNYYLRTLKKSGLLINKSRGLWELTKESKNSTKYQIHLSKDTIRGHAYVVNLKPRKFPEDWNKRLEIIQKKKINHKLVGALKTTPRIKVLGRKVWLCNDHIRIFDKKDQSYYGTNAIESRKQMFWEFYKIINTLENKLGFSLRPFKFEWKKEHYALIKNDLAIDQNQKGILWRIKDEDGEWLLIDDSLEQGGELETVGKKSFETNIPMQKWWNDNKKHNFQVTPSLLLENMNKLAVNQSNQHKDIREFAIALNRHIPAYEGMATLVGELKNEIKILRNEIKNIKKKE